MSEQVDEDFNLWFNRSQPLMPIANAKGHKLSEEQWSEIRYALKTAWIAAYAAGASAESARILP